jgi:hypothetical protein
MEDFLHIPESSDQRHHQALKDWSVIAQLLEERKRIASNMLHNELELLAGYLPWVAPLRRDCVERIQDWMGRILCACVLGAGYIWRIVSCRHGTISLLRADEDTSSRHPGAEIPAALERSAPQGGRMDFG